MFDFAGQQEYYLTHHVFLTDRALYLVAFDLAKYSPASFRRQVLFWVCAVQFRVPGAKVILVGTHADMLTPAESQARASQV